MESATTTQAPNVLLDLGFKKVSQGISLYEPVTNTDTTDTKGASHTSDPTLIILCSWAFAQPKHIAKYVRPYQSIFPNASVLLIQNIISNAIWRPDAWQWSFFQPAVVVLQTHLSKTVEPRILVHAFSNGGSHAAVQLSQTCREVCGGMRMPVDALILDSAPGQPRFGPTIKALTLGIPSRNPLVKAAATVLAYGSTGMTAVVDVLNISEPAAWKLYRVLNDEHNVFLLNAGNAIPRTYFYSKTDEMIMEEDVVGHAEIGRQKLKEAGFESEKLKEILRLEEFIGTSHVNHIKEEGERYWNVVRETWKRTQQQEP
ncbi:hypothetical protein H2198_000578 [Neophaeococcomyces mojaviensis]|uniref:Uncharacterized protein n=1 Tax=Neophaeococcomyces mojaviensis TaxID=3383035 RepID=A0ACC3AJC0_9EURO|nr:hypothetical protein H2198_000578 [Knufia sp. JES_112]